MQHRKMKFTFIQINMKQFSYIVLFCAFWNIGLPGCKGWSEVIQTPLTLNDSLDESKEEDGKDQEMIQSSTTPKPGTPYGK